MLAPPQAVPQPGNLVRLLSSPEGSQDWALGMRYEIQVCAGQLDADQDYVGQCLRALLRTRGWRLLRTARDAPFRSFLQFCLAPRPHGLGLTRGDVETLIGLRDEGPSAADRNGTEEAPAATEPGRAEGTPSRALNMAKAACKKLSPTDRADLLRWLLGFDG
jgi:hypothetical protein